MTEAKRKINKKDTINNTFCAIKKVKKAFLSYYEVFKYF